MLTKSQKLLYYLICENDGIEDKTKLAKLQYFSDFIHYAFHDESISGEEALYSKQKQGPLSRTLTTDLEALKAEGLISEPSKYHYEPVKRVTVGFSSKIVKTIRFVLKKYGQLSYKELVEISHSQVPFLSARDGGIIEFFTAYNLVDEYPDYAHSR